MPTKPHTRWPGSICAAKVNAGRSGYAFGGSGTEAHRRSCFTSPDAVGGIAARHIRQRARSMREKAKPETATAFERATIEILKMASPAGFEPATCGLERTCRYALFGLTRSQASCNPKKSLRYLRTVG